MDGQSDRDTIADEAVGQTHGAAPPHTVNEKEEAARQNAPAPGAEASISEKTAAALGERSGDAYADPGNVQQRPQRNVGRPAASKYRSHEGVADHVRSAAQQMAQSVSEQFSDQRFVTLIAAFGLGFITAVVLQRRR